MCANETPILDPTLSLEFLRAPPQVKGNPHIVIGHYNLKQGLLAGYQSDTGKRILFRAMFSSNGRIAAEVLHLDPETKKISRVAGPSSRTDPITKKQFKELDVGGVGLLSLRSVGDHAKLEGGIAALQVRQLLQREEGAALFDAVPLLYASLESIENDESLAKLKLPFGIIVQVLQLSTKSNTGLKHADKILGVANAKRFRDACGSDDCLFRGKDFSVRQSGLFDIVSKQRGIAPGASAQCKRVSLQPGKAQGLAAVVMKSSPGPSLPNSLTIGGTCDIQPEIANNCFGKCGPGCASPGDIWTLECLGHDYCTCAYSWDQCFIGFPDGCGLGQGYSCNDFFGALWSFIVEWWESYDPGDNNCEPGVAGLGCNTYGPFPWA